MRLQSVQYPDFIDSNIYYFDEAAADRVCKFFERALYLDNDTPFQLMNWQRQIVRDIHGWKDRNTNKRKYSKVYIEVPSGNGKTKFTGGWCLYHCLYDDSEVKSPQIFSLANSQNQARYPYDDAAEFCELQPKINERIEIQKLKMMADNGGIFKVLTTRPKSVQGLRPHFVIFDEVHEFDHSSEECYNAIEKKFIKAQASPQPIAVLTTTAGQDKESFCGRWHDKIEFLNEQREQGYDPDPSTYGVIFGADPDDDPFIEETWKKANPGYGVTVSAERLREFADSAKTTPSELPSFKRQNLNIWTNASIAWLDRQTWDDAAIEPINLSGEFCYIGVDISSNKDLTAVVAVFPPDGDQRDYYYIEPYFFSPPNIASDKEKTDGVPYFTWSQEGYLIDSGSNRIDIRVIYEKILELSQHYEIEQVRYDPWHASDVVRWLEEEGFTVIETRQNWQRMSEPTKEFERLLVEGNLKHPNHPILNWCANNTSIEEGANETIRPDKKIAETKRIDGIVAAIIGLSGAMHHEQEPELTKEDLII